MVRTSDGSLSLRERAKLDKNRRIRAAASQLLDEKPFDQITTREVAERAGIGEATLFRYVASKWDLLMLTYGDRMDALIDQIEQDDVAAATRSASSGQAYIDRINAIYRSRTNFYLKDPQNIALFQREGFRLESSVSSRSIGQGDRTIGMTTGILAEGQRSGLLMSEVDPHLVAQNCHGIYMHEIDRTPVRGYSPDTVWERTRARLAVQLKPLIINH